MQNDRERMREIREVFLDGVKFGSDLMKKSVPVDEVGPRLEKAYEELDKKWGVGDHSSRPDEAKT